MVMGLTTCVVVLLEFTLLHIALLYFTEENFLLKNVLITFFVVIKSYFVWMDVV